MTEAPVEWHPDADFFRVVCRLGAILPDGSAVRRLALEAGVPADRLPAWPSRDTLDALAHPSDDSPDT